MEYQGDILCISGAELIISEENPGGVMSLSCYKLLLHRGQMELVRRACRGVSSLVSWYSIPERYREAWRAKHGDPEAAMVIAELKQFVEYDTEARSYYFNYKLTGGMTLSKTRPGVVEKYTNEASILNAVAAWMEAKIESRKASRRKSNMGDLWARLAEEAQDPELLERFPHRLPKNPVSLRRKYDLYMTEGYPALISDKFGNDNSLRRTELIDRMVLTIYSMQEKPFISTTCEIYNMFVMGQTELYDRTTGEQYDRKLFMKGGKPVTLSESEVKNIINNHIYRAVVDKKRNDDMFFSTTHRPHHHRKLPFYSLSKLTADDRDLPRKMRGGQRVKAYYVYDISSGCVVGAAYSTSKDRALFIDCIRDMVRTIYRNGWPMPGEIELEHHLASDFREELEKIFPAVRWCRPGNSNEKYAETLNRDKKYGTEHLSQTGIGRWWAKSEAYRVPSKKVNDEYVEREYSKEELIADDRAAIIEYNNQLHRKAGKSQRFAGKTRWQVLQECINPNLTEPNRPEIARQFGECTKTSLRHNQYVKVNYEEYMLPSPEVIGQLASGNRKLEAYWLDDKDGNVDRVYLYQGDRYICEAEKIEKYNTADVEKTAADYAAMAKQAAYVNAFDAMIKEVTNDKVGKIKIISSKESHDIDEVMNQPAAAVKSSATAMKPAIEDFEDFEIDEAEIKAQASNNLITYKYDEQRLTTGNRQAIS